MAKGLVAYITPWCGACRSTRSTLEEWNVPCRYVNIAQDRAAAARVRAWTGFESVPTLVITEGESVEPIEPPASIPLGRGPSGLDRGSMLTEPSRAQLQAWLVKHGLVN